MDALLQRSTTQNQLANLEKDMVKYIETHNILWALTRIRRLCQCFLEFRLKKDFMKIKHII
jgi:hypothetical protein